MIKAIRKEKSLTVDKRFLTCFTCTVGKKPSLAKYYINDAVDVAGILEILKDCSYKSKKHYSFDDLRSLTIRGNSRSNTHAALRLVKASDPVIESVENSDEEASPGIKAKASRG